MTTFDATATVLNRASLDEAARIDLPQYVLVFGDDQPPKEHEFVSISDAAAAELMDKQYPRFAWALYHVEGGKRRCVYTHAGSAALPAGRVAEAEERPPGRDAGRAVFAPPASAPEPCHL